MEGKVDKLKDFVKAQSIYGILLNNISEWLRSSGESSSFQILKVQLDQTEKYYRQYMKFEENIMKMDDENETADEKDLEDFFKIETLYVSVKAELCELIEKKTPTIGQQRETNQSIIVAAKPVKLPKLNPPTFSGNYCDWLDFRNEFNSMIMEDSDLSDIDKFKFLKSSLTDGAKRIISHMEASRDNLQSAWNALKERYENKALIFQSHINEIIRMSGIQKESAEGLREIIDKISAHRRALTSLGSMDELAENLLICLMLSKMDSNTTMKWEESASRNIPKWNEFCSFLEKRASTLEKIDYNKKHSTRGNPAQPVPPQRGKSNHSAFFSSNAPLPSMCKKCESADHALIKCPQFLALNPNGRYQEARNLHICMVCLKSKHRSRFCNAAKCEKCRGRHHTLLHFDENSKQTPSSSSSTAIHKAYVASTCVDDEPAVLATVIVDVIDNNGMKIPCRALLDSCATAHFVSDRFSQALNVKKFKNFKRLGGIGASTATSKFSCQIKFASRFDESIFVINAVVLSKITDVHPSRPIASDSLVIPQNLKLADPIFYKPQQVDLLIGAALFWHLLKPGQIKFNDQLPVIQETKLGWIISGPLKSHSSKKPVALACMNDSNLEQLSLNNLVQRFWEIDSFNDGILNMSPNDQKCEDHYLLHTRRDHDGKYIVRLPFIKDPSVLGQSIGVAMRRFLNLEKKLDRQPEAKKMYSDFIFEYKRLNHLQVIHDFDPSIQHCFLPHHCVMKLQSSSTKLRVVFDASCRTSTGVSLNDLLHAGPKLQDDLFIILLRFRLYRFVVTADIQKMYRQIRIEPPDSNFQLIFWRFKKEDPIQILRLSTVTYGTAPGSYLAIRTLHKLADDEGYKFPVGAKVLRHNFYVDDLMVGSNSINDLQDIIHQTTELLKLGSFPLRKFCSNDQRILNSINPEHREKFLQIDEHDVIKALGMIWQPEFDIFKFTYKTINKSPTVSKRIVLSEMASLFDPLGLICPVITLAKIFYQDLWKLRLDWDKELDQNLSIKWCKFRCQLESLKDTAISRFVLVENDYTHVEIHGFADASEKAYGACVYLRCIHKNNLISSRLLCAKSKVAPTKTITLARLELLAAKLLSDLVNRLKREVLGDLIIDAEFLWTDSLITLCWIKAEPHNWNIFVAHRVAKIQEATSSCIWRHVPGELNPADLISRGMLPVEIATSKFWFDGPSFLVEDKEFWPEIKYPQEPDDGEADERRQRKYALMTETFTDLTNSMLFSVYFRGIRRSFAYVFRFYRRCQSPVLTKEERRKIMLSQNKYLLVTLPTVAEEEEAEILFLRAIQKVYFAEDYVQLEKNLPVHKKSRLKCLAPFLDKSGLIRVGGRIKRAHLSYDSKHQLLLPPDHQFTRSLIYYFHYFRTFHSGPHIVLTAIRARYWPINGLIQVRSVIHKCIWCFRMNPKFFNQIMGDLPRERLDYDNVRTFSISGVDFAGPLSVRHHVRCKVPKKVYVALFICFRSKAVHLELVVDLSTEAFVRALKRFVADRGKVTKIFSDNGTNFKGTANQLAEVQRMLKDGKDSIKQACNQNCVEWSFIPPRSPNFGGLWEASIKITKRLIRNVIGCTEVTVDELHTVIRQVAAIINSRPITPISSDPNDLEPLTLGHFIYGGPPIALPELPVENESVDRLKSYQKLCWMNQQFWKRFEEEYLRSLQPRTKWMARTNNIQVGSMILLKDDFSPSLQWPLGRVVEVNPDPDGIVRVAKVRTANGEFKRSISGLAVLPDQ